MNRSGLKSLYAIYDFTMVFSLYISHQYFETFSIYICNFFFFGTYFNLFKNSMPNNNINLVIFHLSVIIEDCKITHLNWFLINFNIQNDAENNPDNDNYHYLLEKEAAGVKIIKSKNVL